jgi:diphthamide biosynthesis enzyme Dph1/Dph2-like protein
MKTLNDLEKEYDLELDKIEKTLEEEKPKTVLLQFPDAFKPYFAAIVNHLEDKFPDTEFLTWFGTCFGACDLPKIDEKEVDLIVQFGHSAWPYKESDFTLAQP